MHNATGKRLLLRTGVLVLAGVLAACGGGEKKTGTAGGGGGADLVLPLASSPTNLDVRVGNDNASGRVIDLVYSGLVRVTSEGEYAPDVAEKWETPDDRTIVFHLNPNAKFHDGRPVTAKDVKFTYDSLMAEDFDSPKKAGYASVASIEAPDDRTVIFRLKEPNGGLFANLNLGIVPVGADTATFKSKPVAAGPYKVVEFRADDRVVLQAFDQWHLGAPKIRNVTIRIIPDATTRVLELRKGTINFEINAIPNDTVAPFEKNADFTVVKEPGGVHQYVAFNLRDPILAKKDVRRAIAMAIDRERIVRDLQRGYAVVSDSMFPQGHWARTEGLPAIKFDPAGARALLDKAGHRDPDGDGPGTRFKLTFKTSTDQEAVQRATSMQEMLRSVGIDVQVVSSEFGTFYEDIGKGNFQLFSLSRNGVMDPDFYQVIFHSQSIPPEGQNRGYYQNPRVDQLITEGRSTFDRAKRKQAYDELHRIIAEDLPYLPLYNQVNVAVMRKEVKNYDPDPWGFFLSIPWMTIDPAAK